MTVRSEGETFTEQARRRQIVDAAIELIAEQGYVGASVGKIAMRSGVVKSAVLYYFAGKDALVAAIVMRVMGDAATALAPAVLAETTALGKVAAYIRANCAFVDSHRTASVAMFEIMTSFRTDDGLRLDQAAQRSVQQEPPGGDIALLDPESILEEGVRSGELAPIDPRFTKNALRAALDGAVFELARDPSYDVVGYGEQLVALFTTALTP
ncbi:MAG: TetR family transcriptional regulator, partial [Acidimicrobiaceae bacterium]|nr:TetR family transcriptional regulator [Acidimicrobiaceae bacterium]